MRKSFNYKQRICTNNKVRVFRKGGKTVIMNEGGDTIATTTNKVRAYEWCRQNRCQPVQKDWDTLEEDWTALRWQSLGISRPTCFSGAKKVLATTDGRVLLALFGDGWSLYRSNSGGGYTFVAFAGDGTYRWPINVATYFAEYRLWVGMDRPDENDTEVLKAYLKEALDVRPPYKTSAAA